jgi:farnesyl diphosphate synthase
MNNPIIQNYLARHEDFLLTIVNQTEIPAPILKDALHYSLFPAGKRIRPLLVYLCGELVDAPLESLDYIAAAIELTHNYSLIQDDLPAMDNDDYRRGRLSCHRAFNEETAILVSDGMHGLAYEILLTSLPRVLSEKQSIEIALELMKAIGFSGIISGQSLDLSELSSGAVTLDNLHLIHNLKTGTLFSACANMALIAGAQNHTIKSLIQQFASHLGIVFQMQDDYQDRYNKSDYSGKNRASDEANQKTTFAGLMAQQELLVLIHQYYEKIDLALAALGGRATTLRALMQFLHQRTS